MSFYTSLSGLQGAQGSTIGPDGALYVTEGAIGRVSRIDRHSGEVTTFASGLPPSLIGIGGASPSLPVAKSYEYPKLAMRRFAT